MQGKIILIIGATSGLGKVSYDITLAQKLWDVAAKYVSL
jgi:hypothetical protein